LCRTEFSTRNEAVHAAIAHFLRASTLLTNLLPQLEA
jgi:hypothetical protein